MLRILKCPNAKYLAKEREIQGYGQEETSLKLWFSTLVDPKPMTIPYYDNLGLFVLFLAHQLKEKGQIYKVQRKNFHQLNFEL